MKNFNVGDEVVLLKRRYGLGEYGYDEAGTVTVKRVTEHQVVVDGLKQRFERWGGKERGGGRMIAHREDVAAVILKERTKHLSYAVHDLSLAAVEQIEAIIKADKEV